MNRTVHTMCPDKAVWQRYLDGSMTGAEREGHESHLARCRVCRERLISQFDRTNESVSEIAPRGLRHRAVRLAKKTKPFFSSFRPFVPVTVAAAILVVAGVSFLMYRNQTVTAPGTDLRQSRGSTGQIPLTFPANGATMDSGQIEFRWDDSAPGAHYEFVLTDEKGDIVFQNRDATNPLYLDTGALNRSVQRKYYWSVTARLPDGTRRESGIASFTMK